TNVLASCMNRPESCPKRRRTSSSSSSSGRMLIRNCSPGSATLVCGSIEYAQSWRGRDRPIECRMQNANCRMTTHHPRPKRKLVSISALLLIVACKAQDAAPAADSGAPSVGASSLTTDLANDLAQVEKKLVDLANAI